MSDTPYHPHWLLRRRDQAAVAALIVVALLATAGWWIVQGGWSGRLVEIDQAAPQTACFEVDVNTADWPELAQLPGIGQKLAKRIVESRQTDGPFTSPDDLRRVRGIGKKILEGIRPYLRPIGGTDSP
jgi:competence protein ComEA